MSDATPEQLRSAGYVPCVAVWPSGKTQRGGVKAARLDTVDTARAKLASGLVAWVRAEDVEAVRGETVS